MFYIIYKITNKINNKFYIGITSEGLHKRFLGHCRKAKHSPTSNFHKAINKYGESNFSKEILHSFDTEDKKYAYSIEQKFITEYCAITKGYNMDMFPWGCSDKSGENNPMYGKVSGNASEVSINGIVYSSISLAAKTLNKDRNTIARWIKSDKHPNCYKT